MRRPGRRRDGTRGGVRLLAADRRTVESAKAKLSFDDDAEADESLGHPKWQVDAGLWRRARDVRNFCVTLLNMERRARTGAERYFAGRADSSEFAEAYEDARRRIAQIDRIVRALDQRRDELGLSKADLARRADIAPEAIRRLFSADAPNPTIATLTAIADSLGLELIPRERQAV